MGRRRDCVRVLGTNAKALRGQPSARFPQESDRLAPNYPRGRLTLTFCPGYDTFPLQRLRTRYETWSRLSVAAALRLQRRPTSSGTVRSVARPFFGFARARVSGLRDSPLFRG